MCRPPCERADEVAGRKEGGGDDAQRDWAGEAVQRVVQRHGARVQPALGHARADAHEERDVRHRAEREELPQAGPAVDEHEGGGREQQAGERSIRGPPGDAVIMSDVHECNFAVDAKLQRELQFAPP
jgi:hypothetical protein